VEPLQNRIYRPIGIAELTGQMAISFIYILQFTAYIIYKLGVINALPLPALDGGKIFSC